MRWILAALATVPVLGAGWWGFASRVDASEAPTGVARQAFPVTLREVLPEEAADTHLFECWLGEDVVLARSPGLAPGVLPRFADAPGVPVFEDVALPDGRRARAVAVRYLPPKPPAHDPLLAPLGSPDEAAPAAAPTAHPIEVVVAEPTDELDAILTQLRWLMVASWALTSLMSAAGLAWAVRRGLAPLDDLGDQIQAKDEADLGTPFSLPGASTELVPVVDRLNGFMERVGGAIEREHSFAAHAAHELRTPLAGLRSTLEVSLSRDRDTEERRTSEEASLAITIQLERLVARLLEFSRSASPSATLRLEPFAMRGLVQESWTPYSDAAAERGVLLESDVPGSIEVRSDRQLLGRVIQNLLENAGNYADEGSVARVVAREEDGSVVLSVENTCTDVDPETTERAFDAFWRSDSARSATGRHAGLGLALCREIIARLGGSIGAHVDGDTFGVTVRLPAGRLTELSLEGDEH